MNKKKYLILFFCLVAGKLSSAQPAPAIPKDVNSLYDQLKTSKADTGRVSILIKICRYDNENSIQQPALLDSSLAVGSRAKTLSDKLGYAEGIGLSYQVIAQAWCNKKDFKKSDELIKKAIAIFLAHNIYRDAAEAYLNIEQFHNAAGGIRDYLGRIGPYEQAQPLFRKAGAFDREGATLKLLGDFYQILGQYDKALDLMLRALADFKKVGMKDLEGTYDLIGAIYMQKDQFQNALKYGLLAEKTAIERNDHALLTCTIYTRIGSTYYVIRNLEQAGIYFNKALAVAEYFKDGPSIRIDMQRLFAVLTSEGKYTEALKLQKKLIKRFPNNDPDEMIVDYSNYIRAYSGMQDYKMAQRYADTLLNTNVLSRGGSTMVYALNELMAYFVKSEQYDRAAKYLPLLKKTATELSMKRNLYRIYMIGFKVDSSRKNYVSAINNYRRSYFLMDSLYDVNKTGELNELKIKFETEQNERRIAELKNNEHLQEQNIKRAKIIRNITIAGSLILLAIGVLLFKSYRLNVKNSRAIRKKNKTLNQLVTDKEWLLKEIHHRVKNNLQIVTGLLQRQSAYIDNDEAMNAIQNSENRMHTIALIHHNLYQSESLDLISMPDYIEEMIGYLQESFDLDNRIVFEKHLEQISLDVAQAVPVGLILNEAVTNAIKYAYRAGEKGVIYITFTGSNEQYNQLTIADNGPGFPEDFNLERVDSLGINLMRGLSKQLGGVLEVSNDQGCTVNILFKTEIFSKS
ncbi:MAG: ATP-binding protein [Bacteroidota bacterium]|nr:ATP-binding protein [Bacteroidota bacterium]